MERSIKPQKCIHFLPCIALLVCTILTGGSSWQYCIIPLLLLLVYVILSRKSIHGTIDTVWLAVMMVSGMIAIALTVGDKQNAMYEYEKMACFVLAVFAGMGMKKKDSVFQAIAACALLTAFVGLLAYCGFIRLEEFTFNDRYMVRLQSFLKYANTAALLLGCGYFSVLELLHMHQKKYIAYLSSGILIAFYLTVSKAAIPLFLLFGSILFFIERKYARCFILQNLVCMMLTIFTILAGYQQWKTVQFFLIVAFIIIGGYLGTTDKKQQSDKYLIGIWCAGFIGFFLLDCVLFYIKNINILETLFRRFDYMRDALSLLKGYWLTGIGPGAWKYYQYTVQTTQYTVTYIHNSWLQMWLEYGLVFFIAVLALLIKSMWYFFKRKQYLLFTVMVFIIAHSFVDINLSFGLILMILGLLTGIALQESKRTKWSKPVFYGITAWCCILLAYTACEYTVRSMFEKAYLREDTQKAAQYAVVLEKICPYDSNLQISLAALGQGDAGERIQKALRLSPLDMQLRETEIEYALRQGESSVLEKCMKYVEMAKYQEPVYVKAEEYAVQALDAGLCAQEEYTVFMDKVNAMRETAKVVNRNELLDEIAEQK